MDFLRLLLFWVLMSISGVIIYLLWRLDKKIR